MGEDGGRNEDENSIKNSIDVGDAPVNFIEQFISSVLLYSPDIHPSPFICSQSALYFFYVPTHGLLPVDFTPPDAATTTTLYTVNFCAEKKIQTLFFYTFTYCILSLSLSLSL